MIPLMSLSLNLQGQIFQVRNSRCEYDVKTICVDELKPNLSWELIYTQRNVKQTAYRIIVSDELSDIQKI